jgi:hypothetical protein
VVRNVAVLLADNTFVLAAFHLLLLFVAEPLQDWISPEMVQKAVP